MAYNAGYLDGFPCWPELTTPEPASVTRFYGRLFGWTYEHLGPRVWNSTLCLLDGSPVAGMAPPPPGLDVPKPSWTIFMATSEVEASLVRVQANSGEPLVLPTQMPLGRMAVVHDREGAPFGLLQPSSRVRPPPKGTPGTLCWNELHVQNPGAADDFYQSLFGYECEQTGDGVDYDYVLWKVRGETACGRLRIPYEQDGFAPRWVNYFTVDTIGKSQAVIEREGGSVLINAYEMPHGLVALAADPGGARFALCQHDNGNAAVP
ncbi:VOC family protein [Sphaerisporangium sp. TRM90804]|uniref:VOC family protein n=1 Tax=Sphaerisporangium sp. TRM90804 TaxID=3031113 RepID=UPI00244CD7FD|nr:VOC family protein [Sphaerisporangium sp. TRM90804]MDH2425131.1 VOC family protein [Sphaerisporangium sp. TRM90804]